MPATRAPASASGHAGPGVPAEAARALFAEAGRRRGRDRRSLEALEAAQTALNRLKTELATLGEPKEGFLEIEGSFYEAINDDLNVPKALAVVWELLNSKEKPAEKAAAILKFDKILGLDLDKVVPEERKERKIEIPRVVMEMLEERNSLRKQKRFHLADQIRHKIRKYGFDVEDKEDEETKLKPIE